MFSPQEAFLTKLLVILVLKHLASIEQPFTHILIYNMINITPSFILVLL